MWRPPQIDALYNEDVDIGKYNTANNTAIDRRDFLKTVGRGAVKGLLYVTGTKLLFDASGCAVTNPNAEQLYLKDKFFDYPKELGRLADKYWEGGKPVEWILTVTNQAFAGLNDIVEYPVAGVAEAADNIFGGKYGKKMLRDATKFIFDSISGSRGNDEIIKRLARLDLDSTLKYAHDAEDTELGAAVKLCLTGYSNYFMIDSFLKLLFGGENWLVRQKGGRAAAVRRPSPSPPPF